MADAVPSAAGQREHVEPEEPEEQRELVDTPNPVEEEREVQRGQGDSGPEREGR